MIKGVAKHAVIISPSDAQQFEQAIFIVSPREEHGVGNASEMLALASSLASKYTSKTLKTHAMRRYLTPALSFLAGAGIATAVAWFLSAF
ncbi:MAG: hypothetical protein EOM69_03035 [Clostridia bacterium]|nr:hypothetical protein [Clostridia bacterium]